MQTTHQMPLPHNDEINKSFCKNIVLEYSNKSLNSDFNREEDLTLCKLKNISLLDRLPSENNSEENIKKEHSFTISNKAVGIQQHPTLDDDDSNSSSPISEQFKNADMISLATPSPAYRTNLLKDKFIYFGPTSEKYQATAHQRRQEQIRNYYIAIKSRKVSKKTPATSTRMRSCSLNNSPSQIPSPTFNNSSDIFSPASPSSSSLQNSFASQQPKKKRKVRFNV